MSLRRRDLLSGLSALALTAALGAALPLAHAAPARVSTPSGLTLDAALAPTYLQGVPWLVALTVTNPTAAPLPFPDLSSRPWLVRFQLEGGDSNGERYTTPPKLDPGQLWTIPPKASRRVWLEVPSSASLEAGGWRLGLTLDTPQGLLRVPAQLVLCARPAPAPVEWAQDPTLVSVTGTLQPAVQPSSGSGDPSLFLLHFDARAPTHLLAAYPVLSAPLPALPRVSRGRTTEAFSRHLWWKDGPASVRVLPMEGPGLTGPLRRIAAPYPAAEPLDRGVTDKKGTLHLPLWVPNPAKTAGQLQLLEVGASGGMHLRPITPLPAAPRVLTHPDAAGNPLIALADAKKLSLYRSDATWSPELPAQGQTILPLEPGWRVVAMAFDYLPAQAGSGGEGGLPGGLVLTALLANDTSWRLLMAAPTGQLLRNDPPAPWPGPGALVDFVPRGLLPPILLSQEGDGPSAIASARLPGHAPTRLPSADGVVWLDKATVRHRRWSAHGSTETCWADAPLSLPGWGS